jgi:predicted secreted acid phosphatase
VLRSNEERNETAVVYKSSERRKIVEQGYTIIMSIGDQWSDLDGEPRAEVSVKLPNPFYFIP